MNKVLKLFKRSLKNFVKDKVFQNAAAVAFYSIFSLIPFLIIIISIASLVIDKSAAGSAVLGQFQGIIGKETTDMIREALAGVHAPSGKFIPMMAGGFMLLISASGILIHLKDGLNSIWNIGAKKGKSYFVRKYILSFTLLLGIIFLLIVSLVISTVVDSLSHIFSDFIGISEVFVYVINNSLSFLFLTFLFVILFKYLPDRNISWRSVFIGGAVTSFLFILGKFLIGFYINTFNAGSAYGLLGSVGAILIWIYYSSIIFFFGAEFTKYYELNKSMK